VVPDGAFAKVQDGYGDVDFLREALERGCRPWWMRRSVLTLRDRFPRAAEVLNNSIDDLLTFMDFPSDH